MCVSVLLLILGGGGANALPCPMERTPMAKQGRAWLVPGWETAWEYLLQVSVHIPKLEGMIIYLAGGPDQNLVVVL